MQIGSHRLSQLPASAPLRSVAKASRSERPQPERLLVERMQPRRSEQTQWRRHEGFADQLSETVPFSSQRALFTYLDNAGYQSGSRQGGELAHIDLYV
ncbi:hypothetical protein [Marinobacterium arenosum]|uniref:hypothetical protein n=1 Tax=Marinobacterium arenosum TaxID=2862496 RepID=UPI001C986149|nr:hypothetical protein [Marinobacterium arenosum]MBY4679001.1 hypothetical protein [Marinobacterium arenosum]